MSKRGPSNSSQKQRSSQPVGLPRANLNLGSSGDIGATNGLDSLMASITQKYANGYVKKDTAPKSQGVLDSIKNIVATATRRIDPTGKPVEKSAPVVTKPAGTPSKKVSISGKVVSSDKNSSSKKSDAKAGSSSTPKSALKSALKVKSTPVVDDNSDWSDEFEAETVKPQQSAKKTVVAKKSVVVEKSSKPVSKSVPVVDDNSDWSDEFEEEQPAKKPAKSVSTKTAQAPIKAATKAVTKDAKATKVDAKKAVSSKVAPVAVSTKSAAKSVKEAPKSSKTGKAVSASASMFLSADDMHGMEFSSDDDDEEEESEGESEATDLSDEEEVPVTKGKKAAVVATKAAPVPSKKAAVVEKKAPAVATKAPVVAKGADKKGDKKGASIFMSADQFDEMNDFSGESEEEVVVSKKSGKTVTGKASKSIFMSADDFNIDAEVKKKKLKLDEDATDFAADSLVDADEMEYDEDDEAYINAMFGGDEDDEDEDEVDEDDFDFGLIDGDDDDSTVAECDRDTNTIDYQDEDEDDEDMLDEDMFDEDMEDEDLEGLMLGEEDEDDMYAEGDDEDEQSAEAEDEYEWVEEEEESSLPRETVPTGPVVSNELTVTLYDALAAAVNLAHPSHISVEASQALYRASEVSRRGLLQVIAHSFTTKHGFDSIPRLMIQSELCRYHIIKDFFVYFNKLTSEYLHDNEYNHFEQWLLSTRFNSLLTQPLPTSLPPKDIRSVIIKSLATLKTTITQLSTVSPLPLNIGIPSQDEVEAKLKGIPLKLYRKITAKTDDVLQKDSLLPHGQPVVQNMEFGKLLMSRHAQAEAVVDICGKLNTSIESTVHTIIDGGKFTNFSGEIKVSEYWHSKSSSVEVVNVWSHFARSLTNKRIKLSAGNTSVDISLLHFAKLFMLYHTQMTAFQQGLGSVPPLAFDGTDNPKFTAALVNNTSSSNLDLSQFLQSIGSLPLQSTLRQVLGEQLRTGALDITQIVPQGHPVMPSLPPKSVPVVEEPVPEIKEVPAHKKFSKAAIAKLAAEAKADHEATRLANIKRKEDEARRLEEEADRKKFKRSAVPSQSIVDEDDFTYDNDFYEQDRLSALNRKQQAQARVDHAAAEIEKERQRVADQPVFLTKSKNKKARLEAAHAAKTAALSEADNPKVRLHRVLVGEEAEAAISANQRVALPEPLSLQLPAPFLQSVVSMILRYQALQGATNRGGGNQASLTYETFQVLEKEFNVVAECFASPLNCYFSHYCSAFPDTDVMFGSLGSFFQFTPSAGSFQVNPPFDASVILASALHVEQLLARQATSVNPLSFIVIIPHSPKELGWNYFQSSLFNVQHLLVPKRQHAYYAGLQQSRKIKHIYHQARHDTSVFFLQNKAAKKQWPVSQEKVAKLLAAFQAPFVQQ